VAVKCFRIVRAVEKRTFSKRSYFYYKEREVELGILFPDIALDKEESDRGEVKGQSDRGEE
jgi:hypothetical protein